MNCCSLPVRWFCPACKLVALLEEPPRWDQIPVCDGLNLAAGAPYVIQRMGSGPHDGVRMRGL